MTSTTKKFFMETALFISMIPAITILPCRSRRQVVLQGARSVERNSLDAGMRLYDSSPSFEGGYEKSCAPLRDDTTPDVLGMEWGPGGIQFGPKPGRGVDADDACCRSHIIRRAGAPRRCGHRERGQSSRASLLLVQDRRGAAGFTPSTSRAVHSIARRVSLCWHRGGS